MGRSIAFLKKNASRFGIPDDDIPIIIKFILCTDLDVDLNNIDFKNEDEKKCGAVMGTADLIGQMSTGNILKN